MKLKLKFKKIKKLREERRMSRNQLSKISGIPLTTLHDLEEGVTTNPRILTLVAIANAFELELSELIDVLEE